MLLAVPNSPRKPSLWTAEFLNLLHPSLKIEDGDAKHGEEDTTGVGDGANGRGGDDERRMTVPILDAFDGAHLHN